MKDTHQVGSVGEARVMFEALKRGYVVSVPHGHDARYDLIVDRNGKLERIQVKTTKSDGKVVKARLRSVGKLDGKVIAKQYTAQDIDWLIVYDITQDQCAFIPAAELDGGKYEMSLRIMATANNQLRNVRWFRQYDQW